MAVGTRERLLDAALRQFATNGFTGTAISDVEAAAGLASGTGSFYRHFRSKEELFLAVIERELGEVRARQLAVSAGAADVEGVAARILQGQRFMKEHSLLIAVLMRDGHRFAQLTGMFRDLHEVVVTSSDEISEAARADGLDPVAAATVVLSATLGYHFATAFVGGPPGGVDREMFAQTLARMLGAPDA